MADENSIQLSRITPTDDPMWDQSPESLHRQFYKFAADVASRLFRDQLRRGIGADGKKLVKVGRREDNATGPPLSPHQARSRTQKWLRVSISYRTGRITLWWSHGWGKILGYHSRGEVIGAPIRDVRGLSPANEARWRDECKRWWMRRRPHQARVDRWKHEGQSRGIEYPPKSTESRKSEKPPGIAAKGMR